MRLSMWRANGAWVGALVVLLALSAALLSATDGYAQDRQVARTTEGENGRFASLRADDVNVRAGPGVRYPVKWKFVQRNMPVQIVAEYDTWRKIRDWEGAEGWVHRAMLSSRRSLIMVGQGQTMRKDATHDSAAVARLATGFVVMVSQCDRVWCEVDAAGYEGWVQRDSVWGILPGEKIK
jgi:SH3-like domain-containing protein